MTPQARLQKIEHLRDQQTLLADKRHALEQARIVETHADEKFRLQHQLDALKPELAKVEAELELLESGAEAVGEFINPYKGLLTFRQNDKHRFFGREREIAALLEWLINDLPPLAKGGIETSRFLALVGVSGSGKSSVVFAGLAPRLGEHWRVLDCRPKTNPFRELAAAWVSLLYADPLDRAANLDKLEKGLRGGEISLAALVQVWQKSPPAPLLERGDGLPPFEKGRVDSFYKLFFRNIMLCLELR